ATYVRRVHATAAAPRPRPLPAPARTCTQAGHSGRSAPARIRADSRLRRTRGRPAGRVAARRATGRTSGGASTAGNDEPAALVEDLAAAELRCELPSGEDTLVDGPTRPVLQTTLLPPLGQRPVLQTRCDDDE